jgi:hypothetical protein
MRRPELMNVCRAAALLCLLAAAAGVRAQEGAAREPDAARLFREARVVGDVGEPEAFEFELGDYSYRVAKNGAGRRVKGQQTRLFNLRLEALGDLRLVRFMEYEDNVLLLCTVDYGDGEGGYVYRLEQPSMRARWSRDVPATGVEAVRDGGALYLAGYGYFGKLDLRTGLYLWQRGEVIEEKRSRVPQSNFAPPDVTADAVIFRERPGGPGEPPRTFRVHKKSGKILGVDGSQ